MRRNIEEIAKELLEASEVQEVRNVGEEPSDFAKAQYFQEVLLSASEDLEHIIEQRRKSDAIHISNPNIKALLYDMHQLLEDMQVSKKYKEDIPNQLFKDLSFQNINRLKDIKLGIETWLAMHDLIDIDERGI